MRIRYVFGAAAALAAFALGPAGPAVAAQISGALFTTDVTGAEVNQNLYANATDVYLNGGPGLNANPSAAGMPSGKYVFMVTDPSGKTLLSTDIAGCRIFQVDSTGDISAYTPIGCLSPHNTSIGVDGTTIQLFPFNPTPNNGDEYKAWATPLADYQCPLAAVDCKSGTHGFIHDDSKTDNFKVRTGPKGEFDTQFIDTNTNSLLSGLDVLWTDTLGASNIKWSDPVSLLEAHVEAPEAGTHTITITNQPGCVVGDIWVEPSGAHYVGPTAISIKVTGSSLDTTWHIYVYCN